MPKGRSCFILIAAIVGAVWLMLAGSASAAYEFEPGGFKLGVSSSTGLPLTQAGGHPDFFTEFVLHRVNGEGVDGQTKSLEAVLPVGLIGNATVTPTCPVATLSVGAFACPPDTAVGVLEVSIWDPTHGEVQPLAPVPLYNLAPLEGEPAAFGGKPSTAVARIDTAVGPEDGYRVHAVANALPEVENIVRSKVTLFGVPFDHSGVGGRRPLITNPTECTGSALEGRGYATSWENQGFRATASGTMEPITGCDKLRFSPTIEVRPVLQAAGVPSGYSIDLNVPQNEDPNALATPTLKNATFAFPEGVAISPALAHGLGACSDSQLQVNSNAPISCPDAANIGSVEIITPLLDHTLKGAIYVGQPLPGDRYRIFLVVEEGKVILKLEGKVTLDPKTGQVQATFAENPPLPFSNIHINLKGGPDAAFVNPPTCGTKTTTATLGSAAGSVVTTTSTFMISGNCTGGAFKPQFEAGSTNPVGGAYSPFVLRVSREDGTPQLGSISATLPKGLLGRLAGTPYCSDAALAAIPTAPESGAAQISSPGCPTASRIGSAIAGAGAGSDPFYVEQGSVYLAGPYKGAPFSLAIVTPAVAGPFDLGNVVVRTALQVNPITTQVTAVSDPLPSILGGVPLNLRTIEVRIDKPEFTVNPTNCDPTTITSAITSLTGQTASPSNRFQVGNCEGLAFKPSLALSLAGQTKRTGNPAITAELKAPPGQANIASTTVILPKSEFIDQSHVSNPCTRVQFNANACPASSVLGTATAWSPLLEKPLTGPVYFRSNGGERQLPDIVADLNGQIHVILVGFIDSKKVGKETSLVRTRFASVPDAPVSKFVLKLKGGKRGLIENSANLCRVEPKAEVKLEGQNGKTHDFSQKITARCGKAKSKKGKKS